VVVVVERENQQQQHENLRVESLLGPLQLLVSGLNYFTEVFPMLRLADYPDMLIINT
jgi:hypothetical protein